MVLCCRRGVDFSMASVRARSASTRERTWSRSEDDILCCCFVLAFLCFDFVRFFLLNEYKYLSDVVFFFSIAGDLYYNSIAVK